MVNSRCVRGKKNELISVHHLLSADLVLLLSTGDRMVNKTNILSPNGASILTKEKYIGLGWVPQKQIFPNSNI